MHSTEKKTVLELIVNDHPGVMAQIAGLFSRRAFNLEAILCCASDDGQTSRMYLMVARDERLEQIIKQLEKLYDVRHIRSCEAFDHSLFCVGNITAQTP
jgi:acetolactate synthase-1/3 small subunit